MRIRKQTPPLPNTLVILGKSPKQSMGKKKIKKKNHFLCIMVCLLGSSGHISHNRSFAITDA